MQKRIMEALAVVIVSAGILWCSFWPTPKIREAGKMYPASFLFTKETKGAPDYIQERLNEKMQPFNENREKFYKIGRNNRIPDSELEEYFCRLWMDNVFGDGEFQLVSYEAADVDQNGQKDLIVMVADEFGLTGNGCIYVYFNDGAPYCFRGEVTYGIGFYDECQAGDIDNDGNLELIIAIYNGGCGGAGGSEHIILKYKNNTFEEMDLSADMGEKYYWGLDVGTYFGDKENTYQAYCPYFDETIEFTADNAYYRPFESRYANTGAGGNCRGFFGYRCVEYEGKNALQCYEYLYGEGGIAHSLGNACFLITWDGEGNSRAVRWWIDAGR
ncbi:MAG: VCBS repeat-containing protein [Lachnospiraceae bacterium]|nr:VCBS repeat-containing protein [Lachnospiraceae bacterium]